MRRRTVWYALGVLVLVVTAGCAAPAPEEGGQDATAVEAAGSGDAAALMGNLARTVGILEEKMVSLAEAMPEDSYGWRPMEGVRSVGDVYAHAAADNFFVPALLGWDVPPETGVTTDGATVGEYEARGGSKAEIVAGLTLSFQVLREAMDASLNDADRMVDLRGNPLTVGDLWVRAITHLHEHLGQSIAYARANGVTPPWSR